MSHPETASDSEPARTASDSVPPLERRRIIGLFVALGVLVVLLLLIPVPYNGRVAVAICDMVHTPMFAVIALFVLSVMHRIAPIRTLNLKLLGRFLAVFFILACFGAGMEVVQQTMGRKGSVDDAVANCCGILVGILMFCWWTLRCRDVAKAGRRILLGVAAVTFVAGWMIPIEALRDVAAVHGDFPLLASFESEAELQRWYFNNCSGQRAKMDATDGTAALEVTFRNQRHASATMVELCKDWTAMKELHFDVVLGASYPENGTLIVKVIDYVDKTNADLYLQATEIVPGQPTHFRITRDEIVNGPQGRQIDLSRIKYFELILDKPVAGAKLRVDNVRLAI